MNDMKSSGSFFSARVGRITVSPSNAGAQRVREMKAQERDIIGLTIGEPDFATPGNVKEAATAAMAREETKYTNADGTPQGAALVTEQDTVDYLLEAGGVAVVPGAAYGLSPYFRMSIAAPIGELTEACQRIRRAVAALK